MLASKLNKMLPRKYIAYASTLLVKTHVAYHSHNVEFNFGNGVIYRMLLSSVHNLLHSILYIVLEIRFCAVM